MLYSLRFRRFILLAMSFAGLASPCPARPETRKAQKAQKASILRRSLPSHTKTAAKPRKVLPLFGPPLPPDRLHAAERGEELRRHLKTGNLRFANAERDGAQLFCVARDGVYFWPPETPQTVASNAYIPADSPVRGYTLLASRHSPDNSSRILEPPQDIKKQPSAEPIAERPDAHLLQTLCVLARHSAPARPLEVLSLFRPPYQTAYWRHGGPHTLHAQGMAVDIAAYGGFRITQRDPESCVRMTLALLHNLPPGHYRLGLPKAPDTPLIAGRVFLPPPLAALAYPQDAAPRSQSALPSRRGKARRDIPIPAPQMPPNFASLPAALGIAAGDAGTAWPFFPAPEPEIRNGVIAGNGPRHDQPRIVRFRNEAYASAEDLHDPRLREALEQAAKRGAVVVGLFPDGADHIHLDVKSQH